MAMHRSYSLVHSKRSPGWQSSSRQRASRVEKRIALTLPFFNKDKLAIVMPTRSASSVSDTFRSAITLSRRTIIGIALPPLDRQVLLFLQAGAVTENLGQNYYDRPQKDTAEIYFKVRKKLKPRQVDNAGNINPNHETHNCVQ